MNKNLMIGILLLGSIWGILEATMGNILHWIGLHPFTGMIMTSIGIGIMAFARRLYHKNGIGFTLGVIAAIFKSADLFVPGSNVLRPIVAILLTASAFEVVTTVSDKWKESLPRNAVSGIAAGYLSVAAFAYFTAYVMHFNYWLKMGFIGILKYLMTDGWMFGLGAMICLIAGNYLVERNNISLLKLNSNTIFQRSAITTVAILFALAMVL